MEESVILHQIPNKKNLDSVHVVSGDANLTFTPFSNSDCLFIIYCQINKLSSMTQGDPKSI